MLFDKNYILSDEEYFKPLNESLDFIKNFKSEFMKKYNEEQLTPQFIKNFIHKIYKQTPDQIIDEIPSISEIIRLTVFVGVPSMINPFYGFFTFIADYTIKQSVNEKLVGRYIGQYKRQINTIESHISKEKDSKKRNEMEKIKRDLENGLKKLENKKDRLTDYKNRDTSVAKEIMDESLMSECVEFINLYEANIDLFLNEGTSVKEKAVLAKDKINKTENKIDEKFEKLIKDAKQALIAQDRDALIKSSPPKLSKLIRASAVLGVAKAINPTIAAVGVFTSAILRKKLKANEKAKILKELNMELEMVEEKIKDADSSGDKKKKYELMRLKNKLETDRDRIKRYIY